MQGQGGPSEGHEGDDRFDRAEGRGDDGRGGARVVLSRDDNGFDGGMGKLIFSHNKGCYACTQLVFLLQCFYKMFTVFLFVFLKHCK